MKPLDNIVFEPEIEKYFIKNKNVSFNLNSPIFKKINPEIINFVDDYFGDWRMFSFDNVKFKISQSNSDNHKWRFSPIAIDNNDKIINISNKTLSYFTILNYPLFDSEILNDSYNSLINSNEFEIIEDSVFQFIDCFPLASVHNLDDSYNLLYFLKKNNINYKLLVLDTDDFFYNQSLNSLKKYFDLEFIYLKPNVNYLFRKFHCTRQYHWVQPEPLDFIKKNYVDKICKDYDSQEYYNSVSIIKYVSNLNASTNDTFNYSEKFNDYLYEKNIFDLNTIVSDLEYKIYLINKSKFIITSFLSPFNINIYKHCSEYNSKKILIFSDEKRCETDSIDKHFKLISENEKFNTFNFYNTTLYGNILSDVTNLDVLIPQIELMYEK